MITLGKHYMVRKPHFNVSYLEKIFNNKFYELSKVDQICKLLENEDFRTAISISSPSLYQACINIKNKNKKDVNNIHVSILKYYIRMCTRPTPFGLFASANIVNKEGKSFAHQAKMHINISQEWWEHFINLLLENDDVYERINFCVNGDIFIKDRDISIFFTPGNKKGQKEISISKSSLNLLILDFISEIKDLNQIKEFLFEKNIQVDEKNLIFYLKKLVKKNFIITNLHLSNNESHCIEDILEKFKDISSIQYLIDVMELLNDFVNSSFSIEKYIYCIDKSKEFIPDVNPFHVDLISDEQIYLEDFIEEDIKELAVLYYTFNNLFYYSDNKITMEKFALEFASEYGLNTGVSLLDLLYNPKFMDITKGFRNNEGTYNKFNEFFIGLLSSKDKENYLKKFLDSDNVKFDKPASFDLYFRIYKNEDGEILYFPSGNVISNESHKTFGRFINHFPKLRCSIQEEKEKSLALVFPYKRALNVSYKPIDYKALNVMLTTLNYNDTCNFNSISKDNMLKELLIYSDGKKTHISDGYQNLHFFTSHMANYEMNAPKIAQILLNFSTNEYLKCYPFDNEILSNIEYLPRIQYKKYVLKLEIWRFERNIKSLKNIYELLDKGFIKRYVNIINFDNYIFLDLRSKICRSLLEKELVKGSGMLELEEADHLVNNLYKYSDSEFIVPVNIVGENLLEKSPLNIEKYELNIKNRKLNLEDNLIYLKVYCDPSYNNDLLSILYKLLEDNDIKKFFFIRYFDPENHIRIRIFSVDEKLEDDLKLMNSLSDIDFVNHVVLTEYNREIERYGGIYNMEWAESVFIEETHFLRSFINNTRDINSIAFSIAINYFNLFYKHLNYEDKYNLWKIDINKEDYNFYRIHYKDNKNLKDIQDHINDLFEGSDLENSLSIYVDSIIKSNKNLYNIYFSTIHMLYNRMGIDNQIEEMINKSISLYFKEQFYKWKKL